MSHLPYKISNAIHSPKLTKYLADKESWPMSLYNSIAWDFLKIAFNKLTTSRQIVTAETMFSFWCTNLQHKRDREKLKECNFCGDENEDWRHFLTCQGTGALIFRTGSWAQLRTKMNKWNIHYDIWRCFDPLALLVLDLHPLWILTKSNSCSSQQRHRHTVTHWMANFFKRPHIQGMGQTLD
jgi:hypothetical protein